MSKTRLVDRGHIIAILLLPLFLTLPNMLPTPVNASPDTSYVTIANLSFSPQSTVILEGDTIVWTNHDPVIHTLWFVRIADQSTYLLSPPILPGQSWAHTFNKTLGLQYYSFKYLWITGFVTVNPIIHDIAVTAVTPSQTQAAVGATVPIEVTVMNEGTVPETFNVTVYYDDSPVETMTNITLDATASAILTFSWNTSGVSAGSYSLRAQASTVLGETDTSDNIFIDGEVTLSIHDIAITQVTVTLTSVEAGETVAISVTVVNQGNATEVFDVAAYFDTNSIETRTNISLNVAGSMDLPFSWDTTDVDGGTYTISAEASPVPGEINITNNRFIDGTVTVTLLQPPSASFTFSPTSPFAGDTITFNASLSDDLDGTVMSYFWQFGDDTTVNETDPITTHMYTGPGTYTVTLQVTDDDDLTNTTTHDITVSLPPPFPTEIVAALIAIIIIVGGGILYYYLKRRQGSTP